VIPWMTGKLAEIRQLIQAGLVVAGILFIGHVWWKTKSLVPTVGAVLLSGLVLWSTANIEWFQNEIGQEMHSLPAVHQAPGGGAGA